MLIAQKIKKISLPDRPHTLPMLPTENNIKSLELWLLDTFSETTFNISAEPLPQMSGKPQSFHITENAIPYSANSPIPIPHHWKEKAKQQLDKDVELGILRKAPIRRTHRMVHENGNCPQERWLTKMPHRFSTNK